MRDVTEVFEHYRLTVREIWNRAIWSDPELRSMSNVTGIFEKIRESLFEILVLEKLAIRDERLANTSLGSIVSTWFQVVLRCSSP
jgi:hypothetical protein